MRLKYGPASEPLHISETTHGHQSNLQLRCFILFYIIGALKKGKGSAHPPKDMSGYNLLIPRSLRLLRVWLCEIQSVSDVVWEGFKVSGFRVAGVSGFRLQGFRFQASGCQGFGFQGFKVSGFRVYGTKVSGFRGSGARVSGCGPFGKEGIRVSGFRVSGTWVHGVWAPDRSAMWFMGQGFRVSGFRG